MELGTSSPTFSPNGDSSTKMESQVPVILSFINKDASDMLGSGSGSSITYSQAVGIFNSYISNTNLASLLDVDDLLGDASIGSIFMKGPDSKWTYGDVAEYALTPATSLVLGGVKIGSNINVTLDGVISVVFPSGYVLPIATNSVLGGVKIGTGLSIDGGGILSVSSFIETDPVFTAWNKSTGISITESQISDFGSYILTETDPVFLASAAHGITSGNIATWNSLSNYTHPTQSAISPTLTTNKVLASIVVNTLGHVTAITTRTLTLADLGYTAIDTSNLVVGPASSTLNAIPVFDSISGKLIKNTGVTINSLNELTSQSSYASITGLGLGITSYGVIGQSDNVPLQGTTMLTTATGIKLCEVINADSANTAPVEIGYGLERRVDMPWLGSMLNLPMFKDDFIYTDVTVNAESGKREWWVRSGGAWLLQGSLDHLGNLTVAGSINSTNTGQTVFDIVLPASTDVAIRCLTPTYLPDGWVVAAGANPNDLVVTHNLGRHIAWVSVFSIDGIEEQLLESGSDYANGGIKANSTNVLTIQAFATTPTPVRIHLIFA
jgi:hypothetical protein